MKIFLAPILVVFTLLTGCVIHQTGNYLETAAGQPEIAYSVSEELSRLYPPAKTTFYLTQKVEDSDSFGIALIEELRRRGFGIYTNTDNNTTTVQATAITLAYIVDRISNTNLYRVVIEVGGIKLIRAYGLSAGKVYPAGTWSRMENNG